MGRWQLSRDGLLAAATCVALLLGSLSLGVGRGMFAEPTLAVVGGAGMVAIEMVLLRYPERTRRLWERRAIRVGSAFGVVVGGGVAVSLGAVWIVAVLVWGLVAYLALVGIVVVSGQNPLARVS